FFGNETPITAVVTDVPIVAHGKVVVRRDHDIVSLDVILHRELPLWSHVVEIRRGNGGKVVAVRIVTISALVQHVGFVKLLSVAINRSIPQVDMVARNTYDSLHHI